MAWKGYKITFRLKSPLHVGKGKSGNLQATRIYITGRTLWGALTARMVRMSIQSPVAGDYLSMGKSINQKLAFTYFYPAVEKNGDYHIIWPWSKSETDALCKSYSATALDYAQGAAETGALYEIEYITPHHMDSCEPVYLNGYIFSMHDAPDWQDALNQLQIGSERCYGWGRVVLLPIDEISSAAPIPIFQGMATVDISDPKTRPVLSISTAGQSSGRLLAHTKSVNGTVQGEMEPLVTREWQSGTGRASGPGREIKYHGVFYSPGSRVYSGNRFLIGENGIWESLNDIKG